MTRSNTERARRRILRLTILAGILFLLIGGLISLYMLNSGKTLNTQELTALTDKAIADKDYLKVLELLENPASQNWVINQITEEPELLRRYIDAREHVELPGNQQLGRIIGPLRLLNQIDPADKKTRDRLLDLLIASGRSAEAARLSEQLSIQFPEDAELLRTLGRARYVNGEQKTALDALLASLAIDPLNFDTHITVIRLIKELNENTEAYTQLAEQVYQAHPQDPRAQLIQSLSYTLNNQSDQAITILKSVTALAPPDDEFISQFLPWLDLNGLFTDAANYVEKYASKDLASVAGQEAILRGFETGQGNIVLARLESVDLTSAPTDIVAIWAIVLAGKSQSDTTQPLVAELARRDEPLARMWSGILPLVIAPDTKPGDLIEKFNHVLAAEKDEESRNQAQQSAYLMTIIGQSYLRIKETEAARQALETSTQIRNSWAQPQIVLAETMLSAGRPNQALKYAEGALLRLPTAETSVLHARVLLAVASPSDRAEVDRAIQRADKVIGLAGPNPELVAATIALLANSGQKNVAIQRIDSVLAMPQPAPQDTLLDLAEISRIYRLGAEGRILDSVAQHYGNSPDLVLSQALAIAATSGIAQGMSHLQNAAPQPLTRPWQTAMAQFLTRTGSDQSVAAWIALADAYPNDAQLQLDTLRTPGVRVNRDFAARAIQRLRQAFGENSINWRLEQARVNLLGTPSEQLLSETLAVLREADKIIPNNLATQIELARCLIELKQYKEAEQYARNARGLAPYRPEPMLMLGQILNAQQRYKDAYNELSAVSSNEEIDPGLRITAASLLSTQGEKRVAIQTLEAIRLKGQADRRALLMLASLYAQAGQNARADDVCTQLMLQPDAEIIAFVASHYENTQRPDKANAVRDAANSLPISPAERLLLQAQAAAEKGQAQEVISYLDHAVKESPGDSRIWVVATRMSLALSQSLKAAEYAEQGLELAGENPSLRAVVDNRKLLKVAEGDSGLTALALSLLTKGINSDVVAEALKIAQAGGDPSSIANSFAALADKSPDFEALHELASDRLLQSGQLERAYEFSSNAAARFPNNTTCVRISALAAYRLQSWENLITAARAWAMRNPREVVDADLMLATGLSALQRFPAVLQTLEPYKSAAGLDKPAAITILDLYTRALTQTGKADQAWAMIEPSLSSSSVARKMAMQRLGIDAGNANTALRWFNAVNKVSPSDQDELFDRVKLSFFAAVRLQDKPLMQASYDSAKKLMGGSGPHNLDMYYVYGQIARETGDFDAAESSFRKVMQSTPENPAIVNNLAMLLADRGGDKLTEAEQLAGQAVRLAPRDPNLMDTLAIIRLRLGKLDKALEVIDQAIQIDPSNASWRLTRADILEAQGNAEEATKLREQFKRE